MNWLFLYCLVILTTFGCDFIQNITNDDVKLKAQIALEQAASMESSLTSSAGVYKTIWNQEFETNFANTLVILSLKCSAWNRLWTHFQK